MSKPVLLTVDDDPSVLRAIERDLKRQFSKRVRVVSADSGPAGLKVLDELRELDQTVCLILADQKMPEMDGVEFLEKARELFPTAKKALLTAYADTNSAIRAINGAQVDYYLVKPWDPPEARLYPPLEDMLDDWFANYDAPADIRIFGHRWSSECHEIRDFLAKNQVPFAWIDIEQRGSDPEVQKLLQAGPPVIPFVKFGDGTALQGATPEQLSARIGLQTKALRPSYDLTIIGAGPAGLAAAVYGASEGLSTVVVEREAPGGQAGASSLIENYLGFPAGLSGADLARRARDQAVRFNVEILSGEAVGIRSENGYQIVTLKNGDELASRALVLATGVAYRRLRKPGEDRLFNKGVYYGVALVEAVNCTEEHVVVVGGANSAGQAAVHFSGYAKHVTMLVRGENLLASMSDYLVEKIERTPNIEVLTQTEVDEFLGEERLSAVRLKTPTGPRDLAATAVFVMIGAEPHTGWLPDEIVRDAHGFVLSGPEMLEDPSGRLKWPKRRLPLLLETSMPGVFVAGDVRVGSVKRVASSVGQGSVAVTLVHEFLRQVEAL